MIDTPQLCDYCKTHPILENMSIKTAGGDKSFCCEGCKCVYQLTQMQPSDDIVDVGLDLGWLANLKQCWLKLFKTD